MAASLTSDSSNPSGAPSIRYSILRTPDLAQLIDVPFPLIEFTRISVGGPDQQGHLYIGQVFRKPDNHEGIRNFIIGTNGVTRELPTLTSKIIGAVSPSGLLGAIPFLAEHLKPYPVTIVDGRSDTILYSGTPSKNIGVVGIFG